MTGITSSKQVSNTDGTQEPRSITAEMLPLYEPSTLSRTSRTSLPALERVAAAARPSQTSRAAPFRQSLYEPVRETSKRRKAAQAARNAWRSVKRAALRVREATRQQTVLRRQ